MWERILVIIRKEFRQTLREKRMRVFLLVPPVTQLMLFGFAVNLDIVNSPIAWMDMDRTTESRDLLSQFQGSNQFIVKYMPESDAEVRKLLDHSDVQAVVKVLPGFAREIHKGHTASVQVLVDGANSNTASILMGYCTQVIQAYGQRLRPTPAPLGLISSGACASRHSDRPSLRPPSGQWSIRRSSAARSTSASGKRAVSTS